tara:strand:+ start:735 stop:1115 length:381 start_codon:yes stop_codon:yes gene_type:complete
MSGLIEHSADARSKTIGQNLRCRILGRFKASDGVVSFQRGISGVTDNGVGDFTVQFTKPLQDDNFICSAHCSYNTGSYSDDHIINVKERHNNRGDNQVRLTISLNTNGGSYTDHVDMERMDVAIFR